MKKNLLYLFTVLCTLSFFTACSDDDDEKNPNVLDVNTAYSGDKLDLKYSDSPLLGKEITFDTKDGKTATITMKGILDINKLLSLLMSKSTAVISTAPGVIPGEVTTTLSNVVLTLSGEKYTFEGTDNNNGREVKYSGEVQKDKLTMSVNVTMPENDLTDTTWTLPEMDWNTGTAAIYFLWESDHEGITIPGLIDQPWPTKDASMLIGTMLSPTLQKVLQNVTFQKDGNIVASYSKAGEAPSWQTSPINLAQYYFKDKKMYVQLNIDMIMATAQSGNSKAEATIPGLSDLYPLLSAGIPLNCEIADGKAKIYMDKDLLVPLLSILGNEAIAGMIMKKIPEEQKEMVGGILAQLPALLQATTKMDLGLSLVKE
mgnify:CR=1 FL=1